MLRQQALLPGIGAGGACRVIEMRTPLQELCERQHHHEADDADRHVGGAPAIACDGALHEGRPDRAGDVVAARHDGDGDAALPQEPLRRVSHQGPEGGGRAEEADQHRLHRHELPVALGQCGKHEAGAECDTRNRHRHGDPVAVRHTAHGEAAEGEADEGRGIGKRGARAVNAEFGLDGGQHHDRKPQPDAPHHGKHQRDSEAEPGIAAVGRMGGKGGVHDPP